MRTGRLTDDVPGTGEAFHEVARLGSTRVEHIVSSAAPPTCVQQQPWHEWVLVLAGAAVLDVGGSRVGLAAGDWLVVPAGTPHRVLSTDAGTHWLAVHSGGP